MLIKLNRNYLKAMRLVTAKEDVRYYLMGIYFLGGEGKVLAYATDGHQLMRWIVEDDYQGKDFEYIINRRAIKDAIKTKYNIHLDSETGELACSKNEDFRVFRGSTDGKYPDTSKLIAKYIEDISKDKKETLSFNAKYLENLGKIGQIINKEQGFENLNVRQYSRAALGSVNNFFTFPCCDDLMYIVADIENDGITDSEHKAVLTNTFKPSKNNVQSYIDDGYGVLCGISNGSAQHATTTPADKVRVIVDYDDNFYMDSEGNIWSYVYFIEAFKKEHDHAK